MGGKINTSPGTDGRWPRSGPGRQQRRVDPGKRSRATCGGRGETVSGGTARPQEKPGPRAQRERVRQSREQGEVRPPRTRQRPTPVSDETRGAGAGRPEGVEGGEEHTAAPEAPGRDGGGGRAGHWSRAHICVRGHRACRVAPHFQGSPSEAERLNTITREIGPSCRTVHVCRTSAGTGALRALPPPSAPHPHLPGPAITSTPLVHMGHTDVTTLTAEG